MNTEAMNTIGSDEFSVEEFANLEKKGEYLIAEYEKAAADNVVAREFLATGLGKAICKTIVTNKKYYSDLCTSAKGDDLLQAQDEYKVWCKVETVFGVIIITGEEAMQAIQQMRMSSDEQTN